jgi:hypothetical protein
MIFLVGHCSAYICNSYTWEAKARDHIFEATLGYTVRPYLKGGRGAVSESNIKGKKEKGINTKEYYRNKQSL